MRLRLHRCEGDDFIAGKRAGAFRRKLHTASLHSIGFAGQARVKRHRGRVRVPELDPGTAAPEPVQHVLKLIKDHGAFVRRIAYPRDTFGDGQVCRGFYRRVRRLGHIGIGGARRCNTAQYACPFKNLPPVHSKSSHTRSRLILL